MTVPIDFAAIRQQEFTALIEGLLFQGKHDEIRLVIESYAASSAVNPYFETDRLQKARSWLQSAEEHLAALNNRKDAGEYELVKLNATAPKPRRDPVSESDIVLDGSFFGEIRLTPSVIEYWSNQTNINPDADLVDRKGFLRPVAKVAIDRIYVQRNVRFCLGERTARTCFDEGGVFLPTRSARTARRVGANLAKPAKRRIKEAYILPFSYAPRNYYHATGETIYGLRYANLTSPDVPIVYDEDHFNLIEFYCDALGIDKRRLVNAHDIEDALVEVAYLPDSPSFFWDQKTMDFFQRVASTVAAAGSAKRIYLSRSRAKRRPPKEDELSAFLEERGFQTTHTEGMSIREQVALFKGAEVIVAPHGAGLTNVAFSKPGVRLIEIFNPDFIATDFYHRLRALPAEYRFVVADDDGAYLDQITALV